MTTRIMQRLEQVFFLGTAILEQSLLLELTTKNAKSAERTVSSFGIVIGNKGKWEVSASIFGCWIGIGFTLDRCRLWLLHGTLDRQMLASILDISGLDSWMGFEIIRCWIDVSFDSLTLDIDFDSRVSDIYRLRFFGFG
ncbi:hypothetical protein RhiirA4_483000 [Rhizophagus irregularis]|uniref:Uncharacterized protein n=1 Tax=Rhizophagus irregularis TaxID=588596 RepID=A0A2I1HLZ1_9GLOM|nr:hypothetical protein RhiirA4_483000 [Rhizophagus irregularis]